MSLTSIVPADHPHAIILEKTIVFNTFFMKAARKKITSYPNGIMKYRKRIRGDRMEQTNFLSRLQNSRRQAGPLKFNARFF